jgi:hypothetical protein
MKRLVYLLAFLFIAHGALAQLPKPADTFGFEPGADYKMATYDQMLAYYAKLDAATDRVQIVDIGMSVGRLPWLSKLGA